MEQFPPAIQEFASAFAVLQEARRQADYSLFGMWDKLHALEAIDRAENAISQREQAGIQHRRGFIAHLLFKR